MIKPRKKNKNLALVAKFTEYSYGYVRQVAIGERTNEVISSAIEAANSDDLDTLTQLRAQRLAQIAAEKAANSRKAQKAA